MPIVKNKPVRKTVFRGERSLNLDTFETVIVSDEIYKTNGENLLIIKDVAQTKVKLDSTTTEKMPLS